MTNQLSTIAAAEMTRPFQPGDRVLWVNRAITGTIVALDSTHPRALAKIEWDRAWLNSGRLNALEEMALIGEPTTTQLQTAARQPFAIATVQMRGPIYKGCIGKVVGGNGLDVWVVNVYGECVNTTVYCTSAEFEVLEGGVSR